MFVNAACVGQSQKTDRRAAVIPGCRAQLSLFHPYLWGTTEEIERRTRIKLTVWAYAYEIAGDPLVTDTEFDALAYTSNRNIQTGLYDEWWRDNFQPHTGQWIYNHPGLNACAKVYCCLTGR